MAAKSTEVETEEIDTESRIGYHLEEALQDDEIAEIRYHIREAQYLRSL